MKLAPDGVAALHGWASRRKGGNEREELWMSGAGGVLERRVLTCGKLMAG